MREIGTLPDGDIARILADYLLSLNIETRLEQQPNGWIVWVCDEDRVPQAREEFADFQRNPQDVRFKQAAQAGQEIRQREVEEDEDYARRLTEFREQLSERTPHMRYVTVALLAISLGVTLLTNFGQQKDGYLPYLLISSQGGPNLTQIARGELWRVITPIFIHFNVMHLLFNCLAMSTLAGQVERQQGSLRLIWLTFLFAVLSNLAQFYLGHPYDPNFGMVWWRNPNFGGLSGVAYGLFGYVWMKSRFAPELELEMAPLTVIIMMIWFAACLVGVFRPDDGSGIANGAHAAGLVAGLAVGAGPHLVQRLRQLK